MLGVNSGISPVRLGSEVCKVEMSFVISGGFALAIKFVWGWELSVSCALSKWMKALLRVKHLSCSKF